MHTTTKPLELIVFESRRMHVSRLKKAGFTSFIVDVEYIGKDLRQLGAGTEINRAQISDLRKLATIRDCRFWCRINHFGKWTREEVENAIKHGAHVIVLPMVEKMSEVEHLVRLIDDRAEICVMMETKQGTKLAADLNGSPIDYVYFGLNDYAISTGARNIFDPLHNGTLPRVRNALKSKKFGFGGMTHTSLGYPVPAKKILEELERLDCSITFLRRSFRRDLKHYSAKDIFDSIDRSWNLLQLRPKPQKQHDYHELISVCRSKEILGKA